MTIGDNRDSAAIITGAEADDIPWSASRSPLPTQLGSVNYEAKINAKGERLKSGSMSASLTGCASCVALARAIPR
jgi:hypothetical protein